MFIILSNEPVYNIPRNLYIFVCRHIKLLLITFINIKRKKCAFCSPVTQHGLVC